MRRLGVGNGGGGDRPLRAQLVVALVVGLILLAVPLYLWRRPSAAEGRAPDAGVVPLEVPSVVEAGAAIIANPDAAKLDEKVSLGPAQRVKCSASPTTRGQEGELCDALPFFEEALAKAIYQSIDCAPKTSKEGTVNYVLTVDFRAKRLHVYPGASGQWKGPQARRSAACVKKALPKPDWKSITHQYAFYSLAILATYPAPNKIPGPPGAPTFE